MDSGDAAPRPAPGGRGPAVLAWSAWAILAAASLLYAHRFAVDAPYWDDFMLVPVLAGETPASPAWFWQAETDHRSPLPKVVNLAAAAVTGRDFSGTVAWNVAAVAAAAALLLLAARRFRGRTAWSDVVFPILLLHEGFASSLLRAVLAQGATRTLLFSAAALLVAGVRGAPSARRVAAAGLCALGLALTGSTGLVMGLCIAAWCLHAARDAEGTSGGRLAARAIAGAVFAVGVAYFVGFERTQSSALRPTPDRIGSLALQVLGQALGPAGGFGWHRPKGGTFGAGFPPLLSLGVAFVILLALAAGLLRYFRGEERARTAGLLACAIGPALAALAVGFGRSDFPSDFGLQIHFGIVAAPGLAAALLLLEDATPARLAWAGRIVQGSVLVVACVAFPLNWRTGQRLGAEHRRRMEAFAADARRGASPAEIDAAHGAWLYRERPRVPELLEQMRRGGVAPFPPKAR